MNWQILLWPFRTTALMLVVPYSIVAVAFTAWAAMNFWVAVLVLSMGLPVWYATLGSLSLYAQKLLVQAATGLHDDPFEREADLNPLQQFAALRLSAALLMVFVVMFSYSAALGNWIILPALLFPHIWLGAILEDSLFIGLQPDRAWKMITGLGLTYPLVVVLISGGVGYVFYTLIYASTLLNIVVSAFVFLYANVFTGLILYSRRQRLNLETVKSPEQTQASVMQLELKALDDLFHDLYTHVTSGSYATAIQLMETFLESDTEALDPLIRERLLEFQNEQLTLEHAVRYMERMADRGELRKAWALMKECIESDERFRPSSDATLLALTRSAGREDVAIVNEVLKDFAAAYPDSTLIPEAWFRRARICIELLNDGTTGVQLLSDVTSSYPDFAATEPFQRYRARLKLR